MDGDRHSTYGRFSYERKHDAYLNLPPLDCRDPEDGRWIRSRAASNAIAIHALIGLLVEKKLASESEVLGALRTAAENDVKHRLFEMNEDFARCERWHPGGPEAVRVLGRAASINPTDRVLVVGIGTGSEARILSDEFGCRVVGIDRDFVRVCESILITRSLGRDRLVDFKYGDALDLPFEAESFDVVWFLGFPFGPALGNPTASVFAEADRVLKPEGRLAMIHYHPEVDTAIGLFQAQVHESARPTCWEATRIDPTPFEQGKLRMALLVARKKPAGLSRFWKQRKPAGAAHPADPADGAPSGGDPPATEEERP